MTRGNGMARRAAAPLCTIALLALAVVTGVAAAAAKPADETTVAVIGAGAKGQALGDLWAAAGYHVIFAAPHSDRGAAAAAQAGHDARSAPIARAVARADIAVLAVPYGTEPAIARAHGGAMKGKILVDTDKAVESRDGDVAAQAELVGQAVYSARLFKGTRFVRAFNLKEADAFPKPDAVATAGFRVPWTTNDPSVRPAAEALIRATGGTPAYEGGLENAREY